MRKDIPAHRRSTAAAFMIAGVALLGGVVWLLSPPMPASRADSPSTKAIGTLDPQVLQARSDRLAQLWNTFDSKNVNINPPLIQSKTGNIIPTPANFPKAAAGQLVSLHFSGTPADALSELTRQTGMAFVTNPESLLRRGNGPQVTLDAADRPFMELVLEACSQSGLQIAPPGQPQNASAPSTQPTVILSRNIKDHTLGTWCVCGPFAFMITQMSDTINMTGDLHADGQLVISFNTYAEPDVNVCVEPPALDLDQIVDDKGNSLTSPKASARTFPGFQNPGRLNVTLDIPPDTGNAIARFRAHYHAIIATTVQTVTLDSFKPGDVVTKSVGGMNLTFGPLGGTNQYALPMTIQRGQRDDIDWANLAPAMQALQPSLMDPGGTVLSRSQNRANLNPAGDSVNVTLDYLSRSMSTGSAIGAPASLTVVVPTEVHVVDVPVEFDNLPLP